MSPNSIFRGLAPFTNRTNGQSPLLELITRNFPTRAGFWRKFSPLLDHSFQHDDGASLFSCIGSSPDFPDDKNRKTEPMHNDRARKRQSLRSLSHTHTTRTTAQQQNDDGRPTDGNHIIAFCKIFLPFLSHTNEKFPPSRKLLAEKSTLEGRNRLNSSDFLHKPNPRTFLQQNKTSTVSQNLHKSELLQTLWLDG